MAIPLLARLIRLGSGKLLDSAVARVLPAKSSKGIAAGLTGAALARIAARSVPGAIVIGGGLLAKWLYDRRRAVPEEPAGPAPEARAPASPPDDDSHVLG